LSQCREDFKAQWRATNDRSRTDTKIDDIIAARKEYDGAFPMVTTVMRELAGDAFVDAEVEDLCPPKSHLPLTPLMVIAARSGLTRVITERINVWRHRETSAEVELNGPIHDGFTESLAKMREADQQAGGLAKRLGIGEEGKEGQS
jgi:hypothetical protein